MNGGYLKILVLVAMFVFSAACESIPGYLPIEGDVVSGDASAVDSADAADAATQVDASSAPTPTVVYQDLDGDGYSPANNKDCNDSDPTINHGAKEICDGKDNNCDGNTDEGLLKKVWTDADQDGYGLNGSEKDLCFEATPTAGLVLKGGDCNDSPADSNANGLVDGFFIHADVTETCGDKIDNDCDGKVDEGCYREMNPTFEIPAYVSGEFSLKVEWPIEKKGQKIMIVPYYAASDIGKDWQIMNVSKTNVVEAKVPDDNACGVRFNTAHGDPANEWLCMGGEVNKTVKISIVTSKGTVIDVTQFVKPWPAPEGGCSAKLEFHDCK